MKTFDDLPVEKRKEIDKLLKEMRNSFHKIAINNDKLSFLNALGTIYAQYMCILCEKESLFESIPKIKQKLENDIKIFYDRMDKIE